MVSYEYMHKRFGINPKIYKDALDQLCKEKYISIKEEYSPGGNPINIINLSTPNKDYEFIENVLVTTPIYTPAQKVFICMFYYILEEKSGNGIGSTTMTAYAIKNRLKSFGIPTTTTENRLKELTFWDNKEQKIDFVELIIREKDGYKIDKEVLNGIFELEEKLIEAADVKYHRDFKDGLDPDSLKKHPIYKKSETKLFWWDENSKMIIKDNKKTK